jgi:hypothetical protein
VLIFDDRETVAYLRDVREATAYSGDLDRLFRPNVTGDSAGSAL